MVTQTKLEPEPRRSSATRTRLPVERAGIVHSFSVGGHGGKLRCSLYEDGTLGEVFIKMSKNGSTLSGLMDGFATAISLALQHGVPLEVFANKFIGTSFEPSGYTGNKDIPHATSLFDYIFRYLTKRFEPSGSGLNSVLRSPEGGPT